MFVKHTSSSCIVLCQGTDQNRGLQLLQHTSCVYLRLCSCISSTCCVVLCLHPQHSAAHDLLNADASQASQGVVKSLGTCSMHAVLGIQLYSVGYRLSVEEGGCCLEGICQQGQLLLCSAGSAAATLEFEALPARDCRASSSQSPCWAFMQPTSAYACHPGFSDILCIQAVSELLWASGKSAGCRPCVQTGNPASSQDCFEGKAHSAQLFEGCRHVSQACLRLSCSSQGNYETQKSWALLGSRWFWLLSRPFGLVKLR